MPAVLGNIVVIAVLIAVSALAVRSLWKSRRDGGHCTGDCSSCGCCGHAASKQDKTSH
ncbi:MAG: FeoB-associated Cys-rich membrane protein [Lawsonibacter sp.]|nr:FeoB-associated Cys-rich membrane protein [Lawsonibacter sp.]